MEITPQISDIIGRMAKRNELSRIRKIKDLNKFSCDDGIIFLGDSIIEGFPTDELMREYPIYNRGFIGDNTEQMLERLPYTLFALKPSRVLILIGTNDLAQGKTVSEIIDNLKRLQLKIRSAGTYPVYLISVLPVNNVDKKDEPEYAFMVPCRSNDKILLLNAQYRAFCRKANWVYIDAYSQMLDEKGMLYEAYTQEGLHLTVAGYWKLTKILQPYIKNKQAEVQHA